MAKLRHCRRGISRSGQDDASGKGRKAQRSCSTHIHNIIFAQSSCEDACPKRPVSANVDTPEESDESHIRHRRHCNSDCSARLLLQPPGVPRLMSSAVCFMEGLTWCAIRSNIAPPLARVGGGANTTVQLCTIVRTVYNGAKFRRISTECPS